MKQDSMEAAHPPATPTGAREKAICHFRGVKWFYLGWRGLTAERRFRLVRCLLGSLLLGAALLKVLFPATAGWTATWPVALAVAMIEVEALLGLWLWWGGCPHILWLLTVGFFYLVG
jgi:hypothetical protein